MTRRSVIRTFAVAVGVAAVVGAGAVAWLLREREALYYTDGDAIRRSAEQSVPRDILWRPARLLDDAVNTPWDEYEPKVSFHGAALFFVRGKAGENADIYVARRTVDGWGEPVPLDIANSEADELGPEPSADGRSLYFYSNRVGGAGGYDIWVMHREGEDWQSPVNVGAGVNTPYNEYGPALADDGTRVYFASNRPRPEDADLPDADAWAATVREDLYARDYDLYSVVVTARGHGAATPLAVLNTPYNEGAPAVSPAGDFLYFSSDRPGGYGAFDIYRSRRLRGRHLEAANLGGAINSEANDLDPGLGLGGFELCFSSDRSEQSGRGKATADYDLYHSTSREVFTEAETYRASIDFQSLLLFGVWCLLTLLLLLLALLLLLLLRSERYARLGLLAQCVLISIIAHICILTLLGFWGVGTSLSDLVGARGGTRVALVSPAAGSEVAGQIRGEVTAIEVAPAVGKSPRFTAEVPRESVARAVELAVDDAAWFAEAPEAGDLSAVAAGEAWPEMAAALPRPDVPDRLTVDVPAPAAVAMPRRAETGRELLEGAAPMRNVGRAEAPAVSGEFPPADVHDLAFDPLSAHELAAVGSPSSPLPVAEAMPLARFPGDPARSRSGAEDGQALGLLLPNLPEASACTAEAGRPPLGATVRAPASRRPMQIDLPARETRQSMEIAPDLVSRDVSSQAAAEFVHAQADISSTRISTPSGPDARAIPPADQITAAFSRLPTSETVSAAESSPDIILRTLRLEPVRTGVPHKGPPRRGATDIVPEAMTVRIGRQPLAASSSEMLDVDSDRLRAVVRDRAGEGDIVAMSEPIAVALPAVVDDRREPASEARPGAPVAEPTMVEPCRPPGMTVGPPRPLHAAPSSDYSAAAALAGAGQSLVIADEGDAPPTAFSTADVTRLPPTGMVVPKLRVALTPMEESRTGQGIEGSGVEIAPPRASRAPLHGLTAVSGRSGPCAELTTDVGLSAGLLRSAANRVESSSVNCRDVDSAYPAPLDAMGSRLPGPLDVEVMLPAVREEPAIERPSPDVPEMWGVIYGMVVDAEHRTPVVDATVRLDLAEAATVAATTNAHGQYLLAAPEIPEFVAVSASADGYTPQTINISASALRSERLRRDFALARRESNTIVLEPDPQVHHLGDDAYAGRINSRFQKRSEGSRYETSFVISPTQLPPDDALALLRLFARGTQRNNEIRINGRLVRKGLNHAPRDGRFGEFEAAFPAAWLREGGNELEIRSIARGGDLDDFEFVNIRILLPQEGGSAVGFDQPRRSSQRGPL